jgi:hypothetical protein
MRSSRGLPFAIISSVDPDQSDNLPPLYLVSPRAHRSQFTKLQALNGPDLAAPGSRVSARSLTARR